MKHRISEILNRFKQVEIDLGNPEILNDQEKYRQLTREHANLSQIKEVWEKMESVHDQLRNNGDLLKTESNPELVHLLTEDIILLKNLLHSLEVKLNGLLVPPDPLDSRNLILEIRAGTGGDEAALFVGDCVRMYQCFANNQGWKYEILSTAPSERGGFKEYIMSISGPLVFRQLRHEAGIHRVQRIPKQKLRDGFIRQPLRWQFYLKQPQKNNFK